MLLSFLVSYIILSLMKFTNCEKNSTLLVFWCLQTVFLFVILITFCCSSDGKHCGPFKCSQCPREESFKFLEFRLSGLQYGFLGCLLMYIVPYLYASFILFSDEDVCKKGTVLDDAIFEALWWIWTISLGFLPLAACVSCLIGRLVDGRWPTEYLTRKVLGQSDGEKEKLLVTNHAENEQSSHSAII
jgi:hypothetical protein